MANPNISQIAADAFTHLMQTTEDPRYSVHLLQLFGPRPYAPTYREYLDRVQLNWYGKPIPRIEIVKNNIARLHKPRKAPRLPD